MLPHSAIIAPVWAALRETFLTTETDAEYPVYTQLLMTWVPGHSTGVRHARVRALRLLGLSLLEVCLVLKLLLLLWSYPITGRDGRRLGVAGLTRH